MLPGARTRGIVHALLGKGYGGCLSVLPRAGSVLGGKNASPFPRATPPASLVAILPYAVRWRVSSPRDGSTAPPCLEDTNHTCHRSARRLIPHAQQEWGQTAALRHAEDPPSTHRATPGRARAARRTYHVWISPALVCLL